jgi:hypothetical protein
LAFARVAVKAAKKVELKVGETGYRLDPLAVAGSGNGLECVMGS